MINPLRRSTVTPPADAQPAGRVIPLRGLEPREQRVPGAQRIGSLLRAGTFVVDAAAVTGALLFLGISAQRASVPVGAAVVAAWLLVLRAWGAYRRGLSYPLTAEAKAIVLAGISGSLLLLQVGPALGIAVAHSGALAVLAPVAFLLFGRVVLRITGAALRNRRTLVRRVLLVGDGRDAAELLENIAAWPNLGVEVVGVCADTTEPELLGLPVLGFTRACNLVARDLGLRTVILAPSAIAPEDCSKLHSELLDANIEVIVAPNVAHMEAARLTARQFGGLPVLRLEQRENGGRLAGKRTFDVVAATLAIVTLTPLLVAIAFLIRLDSTGPAFFRQRRIGKGGVPFELWKFRTMRDDAESLLADLQAALGVNRELFKLPDDPRVTRVGRWLRKTSLDELPQLWNVLLGEMSLVGPRPALPTEVAEFDDFTLRRLRVKPGITGLWQVSGRSDASFATYSRMDAFYAENWTMLGDLRILWRTIPVVFGSRGAY